VWLMIFISLAMTDYLTRSPVLPYSGPSAQTPATPVPELGKRGTGF